ncbi:MAG TPA: histidine kinase [Xanthomonadaceae bacterium]|jgi:two-component system sensor histidine kinase AlgZ|nr:histidine kinase [Xanthomonadaceae bacterium]
MSAEPGQSASSGPLDALWQAPALISTLLAGEGLALVLALTPDAGGDRWVYFGLASLIIQWIAFLTIGGLYLFRRLLARWRPHSVAWATLGLLLVSTWLVGAAAWYVLHASEPPNARTTPALILRLTGMALTVGLLGLAAFQNYWRARQLAVQATQSELEALQARIQPHFLFNTLNTGAALIHARPGEAERLLLDLADLFRAALAGPRNIPLAEELSLTRRYLDIESLRFGERLRVRWELPADLPQMTIPALSIQPLVENAIRHGIEPSAEGGCVDIRVTADRDMLTVAVFNDLPGNGGIASSGHRIGQASVSARIRALDPLRQGRLDTRTEDGRYIAVITLPLVDVAAAASRKAQTSTR